MYKNLILVWLAIILLSGIVYSQDFEFELECTALKNKNNAETVWVAIKTPENQDAELFLLGKNKSGKILWQEAFPKTDDFVNPAKTYVECSEQEIEIISQMPFSAYEVVLKFEWADNKLTFIDSRHADPSAETIETAIAQALNGDSISTSLDEIMYPNRYIHADKLRETIEEGHQKALEAYRAKDVARAVKILDGVLELTADLAMIVVYLEAEDDDNRFNNWVAVWRQNQLAEKDFVPALNDLGFFMQENRQILLSIKVLEAVLKAEPERMVAHLNLADSYWEQAHQQTRPDRILLDLSRQHYTKYKTLMQKAGKQKRIPARVTQRMK